MHQLVYPRERSLGAITLAVGLFAWLLLVLGTFGMALMFVALGFVMYLFAQSALIAHIKGNGVELTPSQFPDLYAQFADCCDRLQIGWRPEAYVLHDGGGLNAFATRFLGTQYVVLLSDVVDAMSQHEDGVRFYIGHELGHLRMNHLGGHLLRWPVLWLPLLGAAYSRACESTCDRHGRACCDSPEGAARALAALSAGSERWQALDIDAYKQQLRHSTGFWMSFHELSAGYPWLTKRVARVLDPGEQLPRRSRLAYVLALFVPYAGNLGAGLRMLMTVYIIGVLAAIALPAYKTYTVKAALGSAVDSSAVARTALAQYYERHGEIPESLGVVGIEPTLADGSQLSLDEDDMSLSVKTSKGELIFSPDLDEKGHVQWRCEDGEGVRPSQLPASCRSD